ncbi:hypothetical protein [Pyrococcus horikoshii]|uniref:Uncharacterized protein n=2 Tax=Pyrococcus horikoshii TaxID=53953 RepID=O58297_PYRHO|nr:hypothetical protein [Pyrococcus horikoshii]BAA29651.1 128aa long hypothetical protein [Pyrococcus horikoshii OT3]
MRRKVIGILLISLALLMVKVGSSSTFRETSMERQIIVGYGDDPFIDVQCKFIRCCPGNVITIKNNLDYPIYATLVRRSFCGHTCEVNIGRIDPGYSKKIYVFPGNYTIKASWDGGGAKLNVKCRRRRC